MKSFRVLLAIWAVGVVVHGSIHALWFIGRSNPDDYETLWRFRLVFFLLGPFLFWVLGLFVLTALWSFLSKRRSIPKS